MPKKTGRPKKQNGDRRIARLRLSAGEQIIILDSLENYLRTTLTEEGRKEAEELKERINSLY